MAVKVYQSPNDPALPTSEREAIISSSQAANDTRRNRILRALSDRMSRFGELMGSGGW